MSGAPAAVLAAVLGLIFGSLASALSYRLPRGLPVAADRSRCPACGTALGAADLVPVLSWLLNRGRCRHCGGAVSWRYPAMEAAMALIFLGAWALAGDDPVRAALLALTGFALVVIAVADLEEWMIPDAMLLFLLPIALAWRWRLGADWVDAGLGAGFGIAISLGLRWVFRRWRGKDALGLGDVKFLGVAGLFTGLHGFGVFLIAAGCLGLGLGLVWRVSGRGSLFPFGPALCVALAAVLAGLGG